MRPFACSKLARLALQKSLWILRHTAVERALFSVLASVSARTKEGRRLQEKQVGTNLARFEV